MYGWSWEKQHRGARACATEGNGRGTRETQGTDPSESKADPSTPKNIPVRKADSSSSIKI
ncbi:hypothetical protein CPB85DRAFT_782018 [Mucidula mucida]|nr:hypothetical protein CPB85DRAFT_782018 [Mucidula mucida]